MLKKHCRQNKSTLSIFWFSTRIVIMVRLSRLLTSLNKFYGKSHLLFLTLKFVNPYKCAPVKVNSAPSKNSKKSVYFEAESSLNLLKLKVRCYINGLAVIVQLFQIILSIKSNLANSHMQQFETSEIFCFDWFNSFYSMHLLK